VFIWIFFTVDRWDYTEKKISKVLSKLLHFVSNGSYRNNDRIIRILSINYAYDDKSKLSKFIMKRKKNETLHKVTYKDIRDNCDNPEDANIFQSGWKLYLSALGEMKKEVWDNFNTNDCFEETGSLLAGIALLLIIYISLPIYLLSRIVTILYPYFIVGYLFYYNLWSKMHVFELTMLGIYVFLQITIAIIGFFVLRTHLWLWHIVPSISSYSMTWRADINPFLKKLYSFYDSIQWLPITRDIVLDRFGDDIGRIIVEYLKE